MSSGAPSVLAAWQSWAVPVWSLEVLLFSLRLAWGCKQVSTLRRRGTPAEAPVLATVASLAARLGVTRRVRVPITSVADGPSVAGWLRPVVLLPSATLSRLPVHVGDALSEESIERMGAALREFDRHIGFKARWWTLAELKGGGFALHIVASNPR